MFKPEKLTGKNKFFKKEKEKRGSRRYVVACSPLAMVEGDSTRNMDLLDESQ